MSATQHNCRRTLPQTFLLILSMVLINLLVSTECTEINIVSTPTLEHMKTFNLMKSLRRFREKIISLNDESYVCVTSVKQKPTDLHAGSADKIKLNNLYLNGNLTAHPPLDSKAFQESLDLLKDNVGIRHYTKQFVYGYRHKQIMSQFDDEITKYHNQKKDYENFTMGQYSLDSNPDTSLPKYTPDYRTYENNHLTFESLQPENLISNSNIHIGSRYAHESINYAHIDHDSKSLKLTMPLKLTVHNRPSQYLVKLHCQRQIPGVADVIYHQLSLTGKSISNYEIYFEQQIPFNCITVNSVTRVRALDEPNTINKVLLYDNLLIGDLEKLCEVSTDVGLHPGDYLALEVQRKQQSAHSTNRVKKVGVAAQDEQIKMKFSSGSDYPTIQRATPQTIDDDDQGFVPQLLIIRIESVRGQNVYEINGQFGWRLRPKGCQVVHLATQRSIRYGGQIYPYITAQNLIKLSSYNSRVIEKRSDIKLRTGMELVCFSVFNISDIFLLEKVEFTVGKLFGDRYFEIHQWVTDSFDYLKLDQFESQISCTEYHRGTPQAKNPIKSIGPVSHTLKLSKMNNNKLKVQPQINQQLNSFTQNQDSIFLLTLSRNAVVQLHTTRSFQSYQQSGQQLLQSPSDLYDEAMPSVEPNKQASVQVERNKYLITSDRVYKKQTIYRNGTKIRLEKLQNSFYENSTNDNFVIIYQGIWRAGDFLKFPRFLFKPNEQITSINVKFGTAFVRMFDLSRINRQIFMVSSIQIRSHPGYGPLIRPQKSMSTQYKFKWGTFCGAPINKNREAIIKMKCGEPWYKIHSITQSEPCVYQVQILTQFLCDRDVVFPSLKNGFNTYNGTMCFTTTGHKTN